MFCPNFNVWLITRYADIQSILLQPENFSSRNTLASSVTLSPRARAKLAEGYRPVPLILNSDGSNHTRFRVPLTKAFAPAHIKVLESFIREVANELVDAFIDDRQAEMVSQFADLLTLEVLLKQLGIPRKDKERIRNWGHDWLMLLSVQLDEERQVACAQSTVDFQHYLANLLAERKEAPQDDMMSLLSLSWVPNEEPLTVAEIVHMAQGLFIGRKNPTNMIGSGLLLLLKHPESWRMLCDHPECISQAIEEIIRFDSPFDMVVRTTTQEVTVAGVTIPKNASLLLTYESGNRDESIFAHADEFQIQRAPNPHLAFGHGIHSCVAAGLARLEGRIAFEVLGQRLPYMRLVPGQMLTQPPTVLARGYERIVVEW